MKLTGKNAANLPVDVISIIVALFWSVLIVTLAGWNYREARHATLVTARSLAHEAWSKDLIYRRWATIHGGVYVPITPETPPSPYLAHISERDISTPSGKKLTLVNPAYMTRQVHEQGMKTSDLRGHITSLNPIRPENAPDDWERRALQGFERDRKEVSSLEPLGDATYFRIMNPLITEAGCLKCHAAQGYKVGDIRGGISVSVPWKPFDEALQEQLRGIAMAYGLVWVTGILGLYLGRNRVQNYLSERNRTEEALRESESSLKRAQAIGNIGHFSYDPVSGLVEGSPELYRIFAVDPDRPLFKVFAESVHPEDGHLIFPLIERAVSEGKPYDVVHRVRHKNGAELSVHTKGEIIDTLKGRRMVGIVQDITERKQAEEALRESEERYRTILENIEDGYFEVDIAGNLTFFNDSVCRMTGYPRVELMGMNNRQYTDKENSKILHKAFNKVFRTGEPATGVDYEIIRNDGTKLYIESSASLIRNTSGQPIGFRGIMRNITDRRRAEEEKRNLEERLSRAEKMEALGTLAGGVAHDLNNVLGIVVGYAGMLLDDVDETSPIHSDLMNILSGGEKAAAIVQDLLTLARRGVSNRKVLNLSRMVADYQNSPEFKTVSSYHPSVQIRIDLSPNILNLSGSPVHIGKTLYNLVSNGCESMPNGGVLTIKTANQYVDRPVQGYDEVREGDYVVLSVSDTGGGIPAADLKRIFEPFYTKKVMGRSGTGLGLAVVWGTVKDHNGYINVQSEEGKGSTFTLYFPVVRDEITADQVPLPVSEYMGRGESILVVDDVKGQRDLAAKMLGKLNYSVATVSSGEEAVAYVKEQKIDLLVLDMIMDPGMDGLDTYRGILEIRPKQKAIIVSGFSETDRVKEAQELGAGAYVKKPYIPEILGLAVRKELDRK